MAEQEIFQLRTALKTETQNLTKTFDLKLKDCQDKLDIANRQNQVLNDQVRQLQTEQDTFMDLTGKTHKQEIDKLQTQHQTSIAALNTRITELQQQLQAKQFQQFQLPPPFTPQNQTFNTTANDTLIQNLSTSLIMQTNIAKQQLLIQAKAYDGKDPKEISDWLDEVDRLSSQNGYTHLEVAIQTSRGSVHKYIKELQKLGLDWDNTKLRLRERYSDCNSSAAAKSKLATLKQNGRPMHSYISNFTDLLEHAHGIKPSNPGTYLLATNFIDGIDESNRYIRNKLRERTWTNLELCFAEAQTLQYKQEIRAIDFKPDTETETNTIDINAIRGNSQTCHKCNSPDHFIKDCPHNRHQSNYRDRDNYKPKTQQDNQIDRLIEELASFTKTVSNNGQNYNRQGHSQPNNRHAYFDERQLLQLNPSITGINHNKSAIACTYRGTFYRSISSDQDPAKLNQQLLGLIGLLSHERPACDQIPANNNQQLLGLIEGLSTGVSQATRTLPIIISNCLHLSRDFLQEYLK